MSNNHCLTSLENLWCISKVKIRPLQVSNIKIEIKKRVNSKKELDIVKQSRDLSYFPGGFSRENMTTRKLIGGNRENKIRFYCDF